MAYRRTPQLSHRPGLYVFFGPDEGSIRERVRTIWKPTNPPAWYENLTDINVQSYLDFAQGDRDYGLDVVVSAFDISEASLKLIENRASHPVHFYYFALQHTKVPEYLPELCTVLVRRYD